jgi:acyl-CoA reductase-like NAD-dependent aldehyde dehydrogenase
MGSTGHVSESPWVGKIAMGSTTKHLTPATLELGSKNPLCG